MQRRRPTYFTRTDTTTDENEKKKAQKPKVDAGKIGYKQIVSYFIY